ncbi:LSM domain-containing protein [Dictyostelium discoideum AX4]|uniref:Probable U6 snRNA-associated Sm-like protein LSm7 n=2 Tax=Dictyostelium TaxID=5782 RepID=LSM7_DICDI|nr:LSM domain-containing protein [Dictyostelium discoideum AX4]Q54HF6.1 RecName: Full=Probable U6 snRNA-associated Sm-like protein LSm7 [Dictyostelium discoideum]EAL62681.1 LSM domain-containing protein [Dictyostelium discoideum AX4]|eukprot:XP_636181.1 LSM domain-containing protein [Dictyostelium discoideum AX4]
MTSSFNPKKESILDLQKFLGKEICVKFTGGREVQGILKGYDQLVNITLDQTQEFIRDAEDPLITTDEKRFLGLVVCRGSSVMMVCPTEGCEPIDNPY